MKLKMILAKCSPEMIKHIERELPYILTRAKLRVVKSNATMGPNFPNERKPRAAGH